MNALRDLGYVGLFVFILVLCFTGMGHCQELSPGVVITDADCIRIPCQLPNQPDLSGAVIVGDRDSAQSFSARFKDIAFHKQHFWQKHPTRTKVLTALGIGSIGLVIGLRRHNCPKVYDGKPYDGTPPCPK